MLPYGGGGLVERAAPDDGFLFTTRPAGIILGCNFFGTGLGAIGGVGTDDCVGGGVGFFGICCCGILGADGERFGIPPCCGRGGCGGAPPLGGGGAPEL